MGTNLWPHGHLEHHLHLLISRKSPSTSIGNELPNYATFQVWMSCFFLYPFHVVDWINHFFLQTPGASDRFCSITLDKHAATSPSPKSPGFFAGKFPLSACQINGIGWDLRSPFERCSHIETNSWLHLILSLWSTLEAWGGLSKVYMFLGFVGNVMGQSPTRKVIGRRHPKHIKLDFSSAQTGLDKVILKTRVILFGTFNRKFLQCTPLEKNTKEFLFLRICGCCQMSNQKTEKTTPKNATRNTYAWIYVDNALWDASCSLGDLEVVSTGVTAAKELWRASSSELLHSPPKPTGHLRRWPRWQYFRI